MTPFARTDRSVLGRWWWTVDRWTLAALLALLGIGVVLIVSGSPGVSDTIGYDPFHFVRRHLVFAPLALIVLLTASLLRPREVRWVAVLLVAGTLLMLLAVLLFGTEAKGARRWISVAGFTLQPSEFIKPGMAIAAAWLFALFQKTGEWRYLAANIGLLGVTVLLVATQPDIGMTVVIVAVWLVQFFLAGLPIAATAALGSLGVAGLAFAYVTFDHVQSRIDRFLDPQAGDTYQIDKSIAAFESGGWFGVGPGNGALKSQLPDAHADFVVPGAGSVGCASGVPRIAASGRCAQPVCQRCCGGPADQLCHSGDDQHGICSGVDPRQGYDPAICELWRQFDAGDRRQHGLFAGVDAPACGL
jgi:cell division protein FtsW